MVGPVVVSDVLIWSRSRCGWKVMDAAATRMQLLFPQKLYVTSKERCDIHHYDEMKLTTSWSPQNVCLFIVATARFIVNLGFACWVMMLGASHSQSLWGLCCRFCFKNCRVFGISLDVIKSSGNGSRKRRTPCLSRHCNLTCRRSGCRCVIEGS